jgi:SAM-dependent methyltransferase
MSTEELQNWERAEAERSASEASQINIEELRSKEINIQRYLDPPADTWHPLEYSFHLLGDIRGKTVLEYGCGDGVNTVILALRGAKVKAIDISPDLIDVARKRLVANEVTADVAFIVGSAHDVPLPDDSIDIVFGMAILHHLDLELSAREVKRVLRKGGRAIFQEPVRNSKVVQYLRRLIPYQSPDVSPFERPLTDKELAVYASGFASCRMKGFMLPTTDLVAVLPPLRKHFSRAAHKMDAALLKNCRWLNYYAGVRVIELVK